MNTKTLQNNSKLALASLLIGIFGFYSQTLALSATDLKDVDYKDTRLGIYLDVIQNNAITLDKSGNFRPDQPINKAAFIKGAMTYLGYTPAKTFNFYTGYSDVPEESWYAPYVKKALELRVLNNKLGDKFLPESNLTRQEALLLSMDLFGLPTPLVTPTADKLYKDIRLTHPLASVYASAYAHGIYFEQDQQNFLPNKILTRGDAADLLFKTKLAMLIQAGQSTQGYGTVSVYKPDFSNNGLSQEEIDLLENQKFAILLDAWKKINQQYVYTDKVDQNELIYHAISGMVDSLDDPYSVFRSPESDGAQYIYIPEDYEGIGAVIENIDNQYVVQTTINNSPADRAGLRSKDIITEVEGKDVSKLTLDEVMALIKGKSGSKLHLKVKRGLEIISFEIVREKISIESMHKETLSNNINYLRIDQFTEDGYSEFTTFIDEIKNSGSKKLIIDLRNNPGGYLTTTQAILGHFLTNGQVEFLTTDKNGALEPFTSGGNGELKDYKIVVLINEGSASAAEIMAGALQDYKLAYLIGTTTFGKGSVQEITSYEDNSSLKLTIAKWLTPLKRDINHKGITPDKEVKITDLQRQTGQDPQLEEALTYLSKS